MNKFKLIKVKSIEPRYSNNTLRDGFAAILPNGKEVTISAVSWHSDGKKFGVEYAGKLFFNEEQLKKIKSLIN